jgi:hypothetical protein
MTLLPWLGPSHEVSDSHCGHTLYVFLSVPFLNHLFDVKENSEQPIHFMYIMLSILRGVPADFVFREIFGVEV